MMRVIEQSNAFKRNLKLAKKRGKDLSKLLALVDLLRTDDKLPDSAKDHGLTGNFAGFRDCHIEPDWLLIYKKTDEPERLLLLYMTGSHADIF